MGRLAPGIAKPMRRTSPVPRDVARRVEVLVSLLGEREVVRRLGVGKPTLEEARGYGALTQSCYERLLAAIERVELEEAVTVARVGT